jgi:hypothetical protein
MKPWKSDVPNSFQTLMSAMNGENSRPPIHRRPAGLSIRVREMDCVLADIQAEIQMLRREKTYLRMIRGELAGRKPSKGVRHPASLR